MNEMAGILSVTTDAMMMCDGVDGKFSTTYNGTGVLLDSTRVTKTGDSTSLMENCDVLL
jgi:hypothetical protein